MTSSTVSGIDLMNLARRAENVTADDPVLQCHLIFEAWVKCFPAPHSRWRAGVGFNNEWHAWNRRGAKVRNWLASKAFLDPAMTLVPDGWDIDLMRHEEGWDALIGSSARARACTPALALVAAALRARASLIKEERS